MSECNEVRLALGGYVLGAIDPVERSVVEAHLRECPACRDELASLAGLPGLLGRVTEGDIARAAEPPPDALLDRVLAAVARENQTRRKRTYLVAIAAAVAIILALGAVWAAGSRGGAGGPPVAAERYSASSGAVSATVELEPMAWGTQVELWLKGVPRGTRCSLVAVSKDHKQETAASWQVGIYWQGSFSGATGFSRNQLSGFQIVESDGRMLLWIPV